MFYDFVKRPSVSITIYALTGYTKNYYQDQGNTSQRKYTNIKTLNDRIYNEKRNCYYLQNTIKNNDIAEYNNLEKVF